MFVGSYIVFNREVSKSKLPATNVLFDSETLKNCSLVLSTSWSLKLVKDDFCTFTKSMTIPGAGAVGSNWYNLISIRTMSPSRAATDANCHWSCRESPRKEVTTGFAGSD